MPIRSFTAFAVVAVLGLLCGCEASKVTSPISGQSVTADQLEAEFKARQAEMKADADAELEEARVATAAADEEFAEAIQALQVESEEKARRLAKAHKASMAQRESAMRSISRRVDRELSALSSQVRVAVESARARDESLSSIVGVVSGVAGSLPVPGASLLVPVLGLLGAGWARSHSKYAAEKAASEEHDRAWDASAAEQRKSQTDQLVAALTPLLSQLMPKALPPATSAKV